MAGVLSDDASHDDVAIIVRCQTECAVALELFAKLGSDGIGQTRLERLIRKRHHLDGFLAGRKAAGGSEAVAGAAEQERDEREERDEAQCQCFGEVR